MNLNKTSYSTKEVCSIVGIPYHTLTHATFAGAIDKPVNKIGRSLVWMPDDVDRVSMYFNHRESGVSGTKPEDLDSILIGFEVAAGTI